MLQVEEKRRLESKQHEQKKTLKARVHQLVERLYTLNECQTHARRSEDYAMKLRHMKQTKS